MGYVPPEPPAARVIPSAWDCEYCGTYNPMAIQSRCSGCGAPFRRRRSGFVRPADVGAVNIGRIYGEEVLKPAGFPKNRIVKG